MVICSLLGNDFVPSLPTFRIREGGLSLVVRAYRDARMSAPDPRRSLTVGGPEELAGIDPTLLSDILARLAAQEGPSAVHLDRTYRSMCQQQQAVRQHQTDALPFLCAPSERWMNALAFGEGPGWRMRYHRLAFGPQSSPDALQDAVTSAAEVYLAGVAWSLQYLGDQVCMSQGWHYPHVWVPTAMDLASVASRPTPSLAALLRDIFASRTDSTKVPEGALHLLQVLPPQSAHLVRPPSLRRLFSDPGCSFMFPTSFALHAYTATKGHECVPLLPALDVPRLISAAQVALHSTGAS
jgi:5'-3' exonuclease